MKTNLFSKRVMWMVIPLLTMFNVSARAETKVYTLEATDTDHNSYAGTVDVEIDNITWNVPGNSDQVPWRLGKAKGTGTTTEDHCIYSKTAISNNISKIVLSHGTTSKATVNSVTIQVYSTAVLAAAGGAGDVSSGVTSSDSWAENGTMTFYRPSGHNWANRFYRIVYNLTCTTTDGKSGKPGYMQFSSAEFYEEDASCTAPDAPTISGTAAYTAGETITLTAICASGADASTTYTWYKGADWATARAASPVQASATGSSGYTFTKTAVVGDAGTYWCEASNGSGCESHNATGKTITVSASCPTSPTVSASSNGSFWWP